MKIINELVELANKANVAGQGTPEMVEFRVVANPDTIIAIAEAFRALEQRVEAAEREAANAKYEWGEAQANYDASKKSNAELRAKLAEYEKQEPVIEVIVDGRATDDYMFNINKPLPNGIHELFTRPAPSVIVAELVPDGWRLVPAEPTKEMMSEGFKELIESADPDLGVNLSAVYRRILASSPTPP